MLSARLRLRSPAPLTIAAAAMSAACLPLGACPSLPERPASLEQVGVRVGEEWLDKTVFHEDTRLGRVTDIKKRMTGELAIVGTRAVTFLPPRQGTPRIVTFHEPAGSPQLMDRPHGLPRYLDRGGGGWQTGAVIGEDGTRLWQPESDAGMDDIAAGDLDGDGEPEFVAGYNGGGGVRLFDGVGKRRWRQDDGNVWQVAIVDTDGDGKPEIVHSNAAGKLTVRDASGKVLSRMDAEGYFSRFSVVQWPPDQTSLLHTSDGVTHILHLDGTVRIRLKTPDTTFLGDAYGAASRYDGRDYLALAVSNSHWDRTQLFLFDEADVLRYREVVAGDCAAIAAPEAEAFLFGCGSRVLRYTVKARARP